MPGLFDRNLFRIKDDVIHLGAGGETPFLKSHDAAYAAYATAKGDGMVGRNTIMHAAETARELAAGLFSVEVREIGFAGSVADGFGILVESMDWRPGDTVIMARGEFPSMAIPFALCPRTIIVQATAPDIDAFEAVAGHRPRVIAVSYVSYIDGRRIDLPAFRALADRLGAELWVDFTQTAGVMPIDLSLVDFAFASCYKWMLGTTGVAVGYWNIRRNPDWRTRTAGWGALLHNAPFNAAVPQTVKADASVFTRGNPAHLPIYILNNALRFLAAYDMAELQRYVQGLTGRFMDALSADGIAFATSRQPELHGASVCLYHDKAAEIATRLYRDGILSWAAHGRLRFSFHGYNSVDEVEHVAARLRKIIEEEVADIGVHAS